MLVLRRSGVHGASFDESVSKWIVFSIITPIMCVERNYLIFTLLKFKSVKITIISTTTLTNTGCKRKGNILWKHGFFSGDNDVRFD